MSLENKFSLYREKRLSGLWIHYNLIKPLLSSLPKNIFKTSIAGYSENETPIHKIEVGTGPIKILFWSQMHGDESTATKSLFDIFNFIQAEGSSYKPLIELLTKCTLVFIPMLNPDGALAYTRENAKKIDLNRDAIKQKSKESRLLYSIVKDFKPNFAFNLHDQTSYYNVANTDKVATLSFLSPAADITQKLTDSRKKAMSIIVKMHQSLQNYIPNQIGRYNDTFCKSCFGDTIQKMNFPTILIESGYYPGDYHREKTRKFHFIALMSALFAIASEKLPTYKAYFEIPLNEKLFYDTRFDNSIHNNIKTSLAVRYIYEIKNNKLVKKIDSRETIFGDSLKGKLFHRIINANTKNNLDIS